MPPVSARALALPTRRTPYRTWPGTLSIGLAIALYVGGLQLWDRHTPAMRPLPAGKTWRVGPARFEPPAGWQMDIARSRPGQSLVLVRGAHEISVRTDRWVGGPDGPLARQQRLLERGEGQQIDGRVSDFLTPWGLQGVSFAYSGRHGSGRLWQLVDTGRKSVVMVDVYGPAEGLADVLAQGRALVDSMDLGA